MSKPINTINLDRLAKALNERCNTLIETEKERAQLRENDIEEIANQAIDMFGGKSIKYLSQIEYDLLSDEEKESDTVTYFITDAVDLSHEHENKEVLDSITQDMIDGFVTAVDYDDTELNIDSVDYVLTSPNGTKFKLCVDDDGNLSTSIIE